MNVVVLLIIIGIVAIAWLFWRYYSHNPPAESKHFVPRAERNSRVFTRLALPVVAMTLFSSLLWLQWVPLFLLVPLLFLYLLIAALLPWISGRFKSLTLGLGLFEGLLAIAAIAARFLFPQWQEATFALLMLLYLLLPLTALAAFFTFFAHTLVPVPAGLPDEERDAFYKQAQALFATFFSGLPKPIIAVEEGSLQTRNAGNPFLGSGPGLVMTAPEYAVLVRDGSKVRRIIGPGVSFTAEGDVADYVFDLRRQLRATRVRARTRDGIEVEAPLSAIFHIQRGEGEREPRLKAPWPYRPSAAIKLYFSLLVDPEGKTPLEAHRPRPWQDLPLKEAEPLLRQIFSRYTLDEIYGTPLPDKEKGKTLLRVQIGATVRQEIAKSMEEKGLQIIGGGIGGTIKPVDPSIFEQRIKAWQARWARKALEADITESVDMLKNFSRIRQHVLQEMMNNLQEQAKQLRQQAQKGQGPSARTLLSLRLLETFEDIANRSEAQTFLPEGLLQTLDKLHQRMLEGNGSSEEEEAR